MRSATPADGTEIVEKPSGFALGFGKSPPLWLLAGLLLVVFVLRRAWIGDDAFITLRVVENFLDDYGLRYNVEERVQVATHPLWLLILVPVHAMSRDPWITLLAPGLLFSAAAIVVAMRTTVRTDLGRLLLLGSLGLSASFVDYSTSGLENPLTHLLVALLAAECTRTEGPRITPTALLSALLALTRPDAILLGLPTLALSLRAEGALVAKVRKTLLGFLPLFAWGAFALIYFGSPFPNTAIAKLSHGLPRAEVLGQGLTYLIHQLLFDPWSVVVVGLAGATVGLRGPNSERVLLGSVALYAVYVVWIGGDFMLGRFWTGPLFLCAIVVARSADKLGGVAVAASLACAALLSLGSPSGTLTWKSTRQQLNGIGDERVGFEALGLAQRPVFRPRARARHTNADRGLEMRESSEDRVVVRAGAAGLRGYFGGPGLVFVDVLALTDPFLARLPAMHTVDWRPGHLQRRTPQGYLESRKRNENLLVLPGLRQLYEDVRLATQDTLWSRARWRAIGRLALGDHQDLPEFDFLRRGGPSGILKLNRNGALRRRVALADGDGFGVVLNGHVRDVTLSVHGGRARYFVEVLDDRGRATRRHVDAKAPDARLRFPIEGRLRARELHVWVEGSALGQYEIRKLRVR